MTRQRLTILLGIAVAVVLALVIIYSALNSQTDRQKKKLVHVFFGDYGIGTGEWTDAGKSPKPGDANKPAPGTATETAPKTADGAAAPTCACSSGTCGQK